MLILTTLLIACSIPLVVTVVNDCAWAKQIKAEADTKVWLKGLYHPTTKKPISLNYIQEDGKVVDMTSPDSFQLFLARVSRHNKKEEEFCNAAR